MEECEISGYDFSRQGLLAAIMTLRLVNRRLFILIVKNVLEIASRILIGRGMMMIGVGIISRGLGILFGPLGWLFLTGWTTWDILGPAYRVTIPAVIQVAYMRVKYLSESNTKEMSA